MIYVASLDERVNDKLDGYIILKELNDVFLIVGDNQSFNTLKIRSCFASKYFTPSSLNKFIETAKAVNKNLKIEVDQSTTVLTSEKVIHLLKNSHTAEDMLFLATKYEKEFVDTIHYLIDKYNEKSTELLTATSMISNLQLRIDRLNSELSDTEDQLSKEQANKQVAMTRLDVLTKRINYTFGYPLDERHLFTVDKNNYDRILYIKELTRVQYVDSLIYYLQEICRIIYNMPTRVIVIEGYYAVGRRSQYKMKAHYELTDNDVLTEDIIMFGMQPTLMKDILRNPSNISILIILDRGGFQEFHTIGDNVEYLFTASDPHDVPSEIPRSRIISYDPRFLHIPRIRNFSKLDASGRLTKYSTLDIVHKLMKLIES